MYLPATFQDSDEFVIVGKCCKYVEVVQDSFRVTLHFNSLLKEDVRGAMIPIFRTMSAKDCFCRATFRS